MQGEGTSNPLSSPKDTPSQRSPGVTHPRTGGVISQAGLMPITGEAPSNGVPYICSTEETHEDWDVVLVTPRHALSSLLIHPPEAWSSLLKTILSCHIPLCFPPELPWGAVQSPLGDPPYVDTRQAGNELLCVSLLSQAFQKVQGESHFSSATQSFMQLQVSIFPWNPFTQVF